MRRWALLLAGVACCFTRLSAGTISNSNFIFVPDTSFGAQFRFTVFQNESATDPTSLLLTLNGSTLTPVAWNVDEEADYYLVPNLAVFSAATISLGQFPPLFVTDHPSSLNVGFGDFYLGINTGQGIVGPGQPRRDVFGWVHFVNDAQTGLHMIDNAVTYGNQGIIIGTTTAIPVPEPHTFALVIGGLCLVLAVRRLKAS
jgi:hypothetical protein